MSGSSFEDILQDFKASKDTTNIIPLLSEEDAQKLVVAWPKVVITRIPVKGSPPESQNERWQWIWNHVKWSESDLRDISGLPEVKFKRVFNIVKGNRLIFPDGTVSSNAESYLQNLSLSAVTRIKQELLSAYERMQKKEGQR